MKNVRIETPSDAVALFRAALPKEQKEERVFVLPLDANGKGIETPQDNSEIGRYFRNRLGLANGAYISVSDLKKYGRTDVVFYKLDDENYVMDFSRP